MEIYLWRELLYGMSRLKNDKSKQDSYHFFMTLELTNQYFKDRIYKALKCKKIGVKQEKWNLSNQYGKTRN